MNSTHQINANNSVKVEFDTATNLWKVSIMLAHVDASVGYFSSCAEATAAQFSVTKALDLIGTG